MASRDAGRHGGRHKSFCRLCNRPVRSLPRHNRRFAAAHSRQKAEEANHAATEDRTKRA